MIGEDKRLQLVQVARSNMDKYLNRPGSDKLFEWVERSDFYTAPASTAFHGNYPGGLLEHSLNVFELLGDKVVRYGLSFSAETILIAGMFHDLCKVNFYKLDDEDATEPQKKFLAGLLQKTGHKLALKGKMNKAYCSDLIDWLNKGKQGPEPEYKYAYKYDDQLPLGHGEKSVFLLERHIALTDEEAVAIRFHMVAFDAGIHFNYPSGFPFQQAVKQYPLLTLLFTADYEASNILEANKNEWKNKH